jgi:hypothetical protein
LLLGEPAPALLLPPPLFAVPPVPLPAPLAAAPALPALPVAVPALPALLFAAPALPALEPLLEAAVPQPVETIKPQKPKASPVDRNIAHQNASFSA